MRQTWHDLLFMHWPSSTTDLRPEIPDGLEIDTFDGQAWIAVVPFRMTGIRFRNLPALPGLSAFAELNVRTYVTREGQPGVWFYSLDAAHLIAVHVARAWFHLPYHHARMRCAADGDGIRYTSRRVHSSSPKAEFVGRYRPVGPVVESRPGSLEHFLTARYCLYASDRQGRLYQGKIQHPPWPLQVAEAEVESNTMRELPASAPLLHFSRHLDVEVWALEQLTR
jgi:hypothetical protein